MSGQGIDVVEQLRAGVRVARPGIVERGGERRRRRVAVVADGQQVVVAVARHPDRVTGELRGELRKLESDVSLCDFDVRFKAHDEQNQCGTGDRVLLMETRPTSKTKRWRVVEILEKAK